MCSACETLLAEGNLQQEAPHLRGLDEYPADWQEDLRRVSDLVLDLAARYEDRILIRIYDPRSLQGLVKSIRHGVRRYPTFVVDGRAKVVGWDQPGLEQEIRQALGERRV